MRAGGALPAALLCLSAILALQVSAGEDLYWEGEEDGSNEFLEVKEETGLEAHLRRFKRGWWDAFVGSTTTTTEASTVNYDSATEDQQAEDDDLPDDKDDEFDNGGSGLPERDNTELGEKTLRVTFVVVQPYQKEYSNRDSVQFQTFSRSLADAVNLLFDNLPGTQRASLVRIQSCVSDPFSCKVTLDIVTTGYTETNRIAEMLRDHIRNRRVLGTVAVSDADFSANVIDPGYNLSIDACAADELRCDDGRCVSGTARCNGFEECSDGSDEAGCPPVTADACAADELRCNDGRCVSGTARCNGYEECTDGSDEDGCPPVTTDACAAHELRCDDGSCVSGSARCNGYRECSDGSDEAGCPPDDWTSRRQDQSATPIGEPPNEPVTLPPPEPTAWLPWQTQEIDSGDKINVTPGVDLVTTERTTTPAYEPVTTTCLNDELRCDETRCVALSRRCDGVTDCYDAADELGCGEYCGVDDFRCNNGKCIENSKRCNGVGDCPDHEDEKQCVCRSDEFRCISDGSCIELRKRCDSVNNCPDGSDELNCACSTDQWQCDHGSCIKRSRRCDGRVDCPTDRSDERYCFANGYFRCRTGKLIPESQRCNRHYDCLPGDYSDEQNCPCGVGDFRCDNGFCIPASKHCDRTHDCQDGSDERHCTYGSDCMASQYKCSSGQCVRADALCNGTAECDDRSDERNCPCKRDEFDCRDGTCVNIALRCDGQKNCRNGEDELNCGPPRCAPNRFTCDASSSIPCATKCDGRRECDGGEDEDNCQECNHVCDGNRCLDDNLICNGVPDCVDGSDELQCADCDGPDDFRCRSGECINANQHCNGVPECYDQSDEHDCNATMIPSPQGCSPNQFQCNAGNCIDIEFLCDGNVDCYDNSDEDNCPWYMARPSHSPAPACHESEFTCYDGRCIPHLRRCDNIYDCSDFSDEQNCFTSACKTDEWQCVSGQCIPDSRYCDGTPDCSDNTDEVNCATSRPWLTTTYPPYQPPYQPPHQPPYQPPTTARPVYTTTSFPYRPIPPSSGQDVCAGHQWRCENGPCIDKSQRCDGHVDCPYDSSDEFDCPAGSPVALNLKTYPDQQTVRNGGDVVFQCRDEGPQRVPVRWVREGGRPLKPGSTDRNGRLEMNKVTASDSGVYICQAVRYLGLPGAELRVELHVDSSAVTQRPAFVACKPYQATCSNGQCIPKSAVCDGRADCSDGSDEDACHQANGRCEPNEYQCKNHKCVLKTWLCDYEDDCGDGSDEENCEQGNRGELCLGVEFKCNSGNQCVPKSFHCDGQSDCIDGSDEIGCAPVYITKPPLPSYVRLQPGETLILVCEAVGVPTPLISWRLNWGHVPAKCSSTSRDGVGTLTCPNMQPDDSGAYSCEAINNKVSTFATPDSIVYVNRTDVCPSGSFNSEARSENDCIACFCFGESTQCRSADLFTYDMPTPLGEGGTRLVGVKQTYNGESQIDTQPITDQYYYQSLRNGATVTKLANFGSNWNYPSSNAHPYLTLPETYNGNQLTSYGGRIKYRVAPHSPRYGSDDDLPTIIIKGKYQSLVHTSRGDNSRDNYVDARLTPENWRKAGPRGLLQASREDIMMALDNIESILLRADMNNAGVNITDFAMESAQHINVGLGAANLVEECVCPPGYEGLSCQKCASGYVRQKSGPWLGNCVREEKPCPPGTYGSPSTGYGCRPCPCPLTNPENQFARTCALAPNGDVVCDCAPGYGGRNCEYCERGYVGNPMIAGDSCQPEPTSKCNPVGTLRTLLPDECQCKDQVQGRYCDHCKNDSFYLSEDFRHGCALCFCSGVSQQCMSSNLRRKTTAVRFNTPQIVDQVRVYSSAPLGPAGAVKYNVPIETELRPSLVRSEITLTDYDRSRPTIYYWSLPASFGGDKVTAYGGYLRYTLRYVSGQNSKNQAADVQLISDNRLTFHYFGNFAPSSDGTLNASVQFLEKGWHRSDGKEISREHFLLALADVKAILVKATYTTNAELASLESASIETAESTGNGPEALHVEQCVCPPGYVGTSCEDCAPGYTRSSSGLYLEHCGLCNCNDHSNMCHPETGECYDCQDNTAGEFCELCKPGYERNEYQVCAPAYDTTPTAPRCNCDPRGEAGPCDASGYCNCKQNVDGAYCDRCRPGSFGLDGSNPLGCLPCYCSGITNDCHEASHYSRIPIAAPIFGDNYGGYTITDLNAEQVINDQFLPAPNESELIYVFSFEPNGELYWSLPVFPGNRVLSYGGTLSLTQSFKSRFPEESSPGTDVVLVGDSISVYWSNPTPIRSDEALSYQVPLRETGWFILNSATPASRNDFMTVLRDLRRVLVRATLVPTISNTAIADVSMDTATESYDSISPAAKGVEVCMCPEGYSGTSCETCLQGYYKDRSERCVPCNCNGHDCQLVGPYDRVICNCRPPYSGPDCAVVGLIMELLPTIHENGDPNSLFRNVTLTCKYRAPERLTIKFYYEGHEVDPPKYYNESKLHKDGWHGEHVWHTVWDTRRRGEIYECHTLTERGSTLGLLSTSLPEPGGDSSTNATIRPPPQEPTVYVRITSPKIKIQEVGSSVSFTCEAISRNTRRPLPVTWTKSGGFLPPDRSQVDQSNGMLLITNLQPSDSGVYICQTTDGISTAQAIATLKVPGNEMTLPSVTIEPTINEYYEGDRIELQCIATGNPTPRISWQRASGYPLPLTAESYGERFIIPSAKEEDSGEYRCIATNTAGPAYHTALITVRPRPSWPPRDRLTVSPSASTVTEGQSTRLVCTGTTNVGAGTINWVRKDGSDFLSNVRSDNGVLYIDIARPENQGVYICQATSSQAAPVPVLVTIVPLGPLPPSETSNITVSVDRVRIPTGGSATVDCNPTGYPLPLIRWKKHQSEFGPGVSQRENTLIISNAQEDDQGYYLCEGTVNGSPVANIYVFVEIEKREPPQVEIYPQGEQAVTLGSRFELLCRVLKGIPEPDVLWGRTGGRPLSTYAQIQPHNVLSFESIEVNDEGEYTCTATNVAGSNSASAVIKVRSAPEILITPSSYVETQIGDSVTIECRASGYPEPYVSIKTIPDQRELVPQSPNIAVLRIGSVSDRDEGSYTCSATSAAGTIEEQFVIRVEGRGDVGFVDNGGSGEGELGPQYPPGSNRQPGSLIAFEGEDRQIECSAPAGTDVVWSRTGRPLQRNAQQSGASLIIYNASKSDSGDYECNVIDPYTRDVQQAAYTRLQIVAAPRITLQPKTQTVHPGQSPTVLCVVDGDDIIDVTWRPVNRPLSRRVEIRDSTLIFHQIEVEDAGQYECLARSRYANASAAAEVIVSEENGSATSESHDNEQYAHVGAAVQLSCNVTQPNLRIRWTKDGRNVPRSVRQKQDGSLFIRLAQKSDSGHYVCLIQDDYGRQTSNYINLHIEGNECLESQFRCSDGTSCIDEYLLCDGYSDCQDNSDEENCILNDRPPSQTLLDYDPTLDGPREDGPSLVTIEPPSRQFMVGDNVEVLCRASTRGTQVNWERYNNNQRQYVDARNYGDGSMLVIRGVEQSDAGVYRCTGTDPYGRTSYEDYNLEVQPASISPAYPIGDQNTVYTANLGQIVDLPCKHNLEQPVYIEWRREYTPLPAEVATNEPNLHLPSVSEADAGTYVCRVSNDRAAVEARATLRVMGVVPQFGGDSYIAMRTLKDAYRQFDIEISFKPRDEHGLILYNSQNQDRTGKYLALQLVEGVPNFVLDTGSGPVVVRGDRPLQLNTWHTIRLSRTNNKVTMDVDNTGPFTDESSEKWDLLELYKPLYIGGVPDYNQLPPQLAGASGFIGCVSMLILGREEKNIMVDSIEKYNIKDCDSCTPNLCLNEGVCQEARNERGYMCLCAAGFAGITCDRPGESCRPGLCGPGRCSNTVDGYKCACPVTYTGRNCDVKQSIEYPAFTGSAYLAIRAPKASRVFQMSMKIKASAPITDGIIMYCAESARGYGGFMSLTVHDEKLEFRYYLGDGSAPIILTANKTLPANEWTDVHISRIGPAVALKINFLQEFVQKLVSPRTDLNLETPMFVGGVDDSIVLNNNTGVTGGFSGCIKDVMVYDDHVDIVNSSIQSANVQECSNYDRGDIPEIQSVCSQCRNGGYCPSPDQSSCTCPAGFTGTYCEARAPAPPAWRSRGDPCAAQPCRNGGTCRPDRTKSMNYSCDCPLRFAGANCHMPLELHQSVGFNGDGYMELLSGLLRYDNLQNEEVLIALAFYTTKDGVLLYQREALSPVNYGDYILLRVEQGKLVLDWDFGGGLSSITVNEVYVINGESHQVVIKLLPDHTVSMTVDRDYFKTGTTTGLSNLMNADSNVYIGGIPDRYNVNHYPGFTGCVEQIELMDTSRGLNVGEFAVAGRNTQRCRDPGSY